MKSKTLVITLFLAVFSCAFVAVSPIAAATGPDAAEEAASEATEEAEEANEEVTAAPMQLAVTLGHPNYKSRIEWRIARLKRLIANVRITKKIDRLLPHNTVRYQVHLPKKRKLIKEYRERIHELRACTRPEPGLC